MAWANLNALLTRAAIQSRIEAMGFKQLQMERLPNLCMGTGTWVWVVLWQTIWENSACITVVAPADDVDLQFHGLLT